MHIKKINKKMNNEAAHWKKTLGDYDIKLMRSKVQHQFEIQIPDKLVEG